MTFKDLNITSTSLFKPLFEESFGGADDQIKFPYCCSKVKDKSKYCSNCGQKIKW